jgi:hypothetical protein
MTPARCRSCRTPILWLRTESGKAMPVDDRPGEPLREGETFEAARARIGADAVVSHFATCPNAAAHRGAR